MNKAKIGLVGVASPVESGGERADDLLNSAKKALEKKELDVTMAKKVVWDAADAIDVCKQFEKESIESLIIMDITWVTDSLKYLFINELRLPTVFWAVPYPETFSIGCIQHFGSILTEHSIPFQYVYGLPEEENVVEKVRKIAQAGTIISKVRNMRIALMGPRQTWRVAGPQDMTNEEWEFSKKFGLTLVHIEMEEVTDEAEKISDSEAESTLEALKDRTGKVLVSKESMLYNAKIYMAVKKIIEKYDLNAIAAECYPKYGGLMNLPSSWIADDGFILDTEGDISHCMVMYMMNLAAGGGAVALGEVGKIEMEENYLAVAHEGSTAASCAETKDRVQINPSGELGTFVGLPLKPMPDVTVADMQGCEGHYQMLVSKAKTLPITHEQWVEGGEKLLAHLQFEKDARTMVDAMIDAGLDHHLLMKEGDFTEVMSIICDYMGIKKVQL